MEIYITTLPFLPTKKNKLPKISSTKFNIHTKQVKRMFKLEMDGDYLLKNIKTWKTFYTILFSFADN